MINDISDGVGREIPIEPGVRASGIHVGVKAVWSSGASGGTGINAGDRRHGQDAALKSRNDRVKIVPIGRVCELAHNFGAGIRADLGDRVVIVIVSNWIENAALNYVVRRRSLRWRP